MSEVIVGNAATDGAAFRGWFVGHFVPADLGLRSTDDVEIKWQCHTRGDTRADWGVTPQATSVSVLIQGRIRYVFGDGREAVLREAGEYALWAPGTSHRWYIEEDDTVVLTVRWPSV
jgi:hypothetical protein